jgi:hypothetical protein
MAHAPLDGTSLKADIAPSPSMQRSFGPWREWTRHAADLGSRHLPDEARRPSRCHLPGRRDRARRRHHIRQAAGPQVRCGRSRKDGLQIAEVSEPGAVFGELSMLLDQPHAADVRAQEVTEFHVADAASLLTDDPATLLYVTVLLARRLDATNRALIEVKRQIQAGQPRSTISRTVEKAEELLNYGGGASLVYAGYPYDPHESAAP